MSSPSTESFRLHRSFVDVDDLTSEARHWNLDFRQLDRGPFRGDLLQFVAHGVQVADARFGRTLHQTGAPPSNLRTIAVPATPDLQLVWRGKQIDGNSLMLFPRGGEFASVSRPDFHVYTCSFPEPILDSVCQSLQLGHAANFAMPSRRSRAIQCRCELCGVVSTIYAMRFVTESSDHLEISLPIG